MDHPVASLPWYDLPELRDATDAFFGCIRDALAQRPQSQTLSLSLPQQMSRELSFEQQWSSSHLVFSQACGPDLGLQPRLRVIAAPVFDLDAVNDAPRSAGARGAYFSLLLTRDIGGESLALPVDFSAIPDAPSSADIALLRGKAVAINSWSSWSGCAALRCAVAAHLTTTSTSTSTTSAGDVFFGSVTVSASHRASLRMLRDGAVDCCAVDALVVALLSDVAPDELRGLRVLGRTALAPSPPYVTSARLSSAHVSLLQQALLDAVQQCPASVLRRLRLRSIDVTAATDDRYADARREDALAATLAIFPPQCPRLVASQGCAEMTALAAATATVSSASTQTNAQRVAAVTTVQ